MSSNHPAREYYSGKHDAINTYGKNASEFPCEVNAKSQHYSAREHSGIDERHLTQLHIPASADHFGKYVPANHYKTAETPYVYIP